MFQGCRALHANLLKQQQIYLGKITKWLLSKKMHKYIHFRNGYR